MFSLIITVVSIALVAALAIATLYYGGTSWGQGGDSARAAQIMTQGQQVLGAADTFRAERGRWPNSMEELVAEKYLKEIPSLVKEVAVAGAAGVPGLGGAAHAAGERTTVAWTMPTAGRPTFVLDSAINAAVCKLVNERGRGDNGILKKARTTLSTQCYGESERELTVVVTREAQGLSDSLPAEHVTSSGLPLLNGELDPASAEWLAPPGAETAGPDAQPNTKPSPLSVVKFSDVSPDNWFVEEGAGGYVLSLSGNRLTWTDPNARGLEILLIQNKSNSPVAFPFVEHGPMIAGLTTMAEEYGVTPEVAREEDLVYYGYSFCETNGVLPAGGGCLVRIEELSNCEVKTPAKLGTWDIEVKACEVYAEFYPYHLNWSTAESYVSWTGESKPWPTVPYLELHDHYVGPQTGFVGSHVDYIDVSFTPVGSRPVNVNVVSAEFTYSGTAVAPGKYLLSKAQAQAVLPSQGPAGVVIVENLSATTVIESVKTDLGIAQGLSAKYSSSWPDGTPFTVYSDTAGNPLFDYWYAQYGDTKKRGVTDFKQDEVGVAGHAANGDFGAEYNYYVFSGDAPANRTVLGSVVYSSGGGGYFTFSIPRPAPAEEPDRATSPLYNKITARIAYTHNGGPVQYVQKEYPLIAMDR